VYFCCVSRAFLSAAGIAVILSLQSLVVVSTALLVFFDLEVGGCFDLRLLSLEFCELCVNTIDGLLDFLFGLFELL